LTWTIVPLVNAKLEIQSVQLIYAKGFKHHPKGSSKVGAFYPIGENPQTTNKIVIASGFATALSLYQAQAAPCVINAIDDGNVQAVINTLKSINSKAEIIIAADDDHEKIPNSGLTKGLKNAQKFQISWTYPTRDKLGKGTDFNDVHCEQGIDAVLEQFNANLSVPKKAEIEQPQIQSTDTGQKGVVVKDNEGNKDMELKQPSSFVKFDGALRFDTGRFDKEKNPIYKLTYPGFFQPTALHINADTGDTWVAI